MPLHKLPSNQVQAFTARADGRLSSLRTEIEVWPAFHPEKGVSPPPSKKYVGIYDTGATGSAISKKVAQDLNLECIGVINVQTAKGIHECDTFLINIGMPNRVLFPMIRVSTADLPAGIDMLIGMDIICSGDFAITNFDRKTTFSFRIPSTGEIDFVKELEDKNKPVPTHSDKVGRNEPCPCGSGKKFKHCCGK
ncbi:MAG TPA: SEC-C metal-binding domain-containing protein [Acidobacteriota bacterium]|nr:SEC-C metal-binding domain-containing protein [Acidobacteriota bacterium]